MVAVLDDVSDVASRLKGAGFDIEVLSGEAGKQHLDPAGTSGGAVSTLKRLLNAFGDQYRVLERLYEELDAGKHVVSIAASPDEADEAVKVLQEHDGKYIWKFGTWTYTEIGDCPGTDSTVARTRPFSTGLITDYHLQPMGLTINSRELPNGWICIAVEGEVDLATVDELQAAIDSVLADQGGHVVVDLTSSSFMDSTGLKALVLSHRKFDDVGRSFAIAIDSGPISRLIDLSGVDKTIRTVPSVEELG